MAHWRASGLPDGAPVAAPKSVRQWGIGYPQPHPSSEFLSPFPNPSPFSPPPALPPSSTAFSLLPSTSCLPLPWPRLSPLSSSLFPPPSFPSPFPSLLWPFSQTFVRLPLSPCPMSPHWPPEGACFKQPDKAVCAQKPQKPVLSLGSESLTLGSLLAPSRSRPFEALPSDFIPLVPTFEPCPGQGGQADRQVGR